MEEEYVKIIHERQQEALEEKIFEKGQTMALYLGALKEREDGLCDSYSDTLHLYVNNVYGITVKHIVNKNHGLEKNIVHILATNDEGRWGTVYEGHMAKLNPKDLLSGEENPYLEVTSYIPGKNWQAKFESLHKDAEKVKQKAEKTMLEKLKEEEAEAEKAQLRRFGILGYSKDDLKEI